MIPSLFLLLAALIVYGQQADLTEWQFFCQFWVLEMDVIKGIIFLNATRKQSGVLRGKEFSIYVWLISAKAVFDLLAVFECFDQIWGRLDWTALHQVYHSLANRHHLQQTFYIQQQTVTFIQLIFHLPEQLLIERFISVYLLIRKTYNDFRPIL